MKQAEVLLRPVSFDFSPQFIDSSDQSDRGDGMTTHTGPWGGAIGTTTWEITNIQPPSEGMKHTVTVSFIGLRGKIDCVELKHDDAVELKEGDLLPEKHRPI